MGRHDHVTMPLLAERVSIDRAVISAPLVTTLVDATGLIIQFLIASAVLSVQGRIERAGGRCVAEHWARCGEPGGESTPVGICGVRRG
nr:magnesium transporter [Actinokineospora iranica]